MFKSKMFLNILAVIVVLITGANYAQADCKKCKINTMTQRFQCYSSTNGGLTCNVTNNGYSCNVDGICIYAPYQGITMNTRYAIKLDPKVIRDIAQKQARFAATLASLCNQGTFADGSAISWIGKEFTYNDLEYLLGQIVSPAATANTRPSPYFTSATNFPSGTDIPTVDHSITISAVSYDYKQLHISINAVDSSGKDKFSSLELTTTINTVSKQNDTEVLGLVVTGWELK